jgi:hypothetical protein
VGVTLPIWDRALASESVDIFGVLVAGVVGVVETLVNSVVGVFGAVGVVLVTGVVGAVAVLGNGVVGVVGVLVTGVVGAVAVVAFVVGAVAFLVNGIAGVIGVVGVFDGVGAAGVVGVVEVVVGVLSIATSGVRFVFGLLIFFSPAEGSIARGASGVGETKGLEGEGESGSVIFGTSFFVGGGATCAKISGVKCARCSSRERSLAWASRFLGDRGGLLGGSTAWSRRLARGFPAARVGDTVGDLGGERATPRGTRNSCSEPSCAIGWDIPKPDSDFCRLARLRTGEDEGLLVFGATVTSLGGAA